MTANSRRLRSGAALAAIASAAAMVAAPPPAVATVQDPQVQVPRPFRATVDLVTIDVSVRDGNVPVAGLTADNFVLTDNGVAQTVEVVSLESLPIDVTILIDTSGSMAGDLDAVLAQARDAAALARPGDRIRTVTFAYDVLTSRFEDAARRAAVTAPEADGATALIDGLGMALMHARVDERRHLVIAYTDGWDNFSTLGMQDLELISRRTDSVLHVLQVINTRPIRTTRTRSALDTRNRWRPPRAQPALALMVETLPLGPIARNTGGDIRALGVRADSVDAIREVIDLFRSSYVVAYRPDGVELPGWHDIRVRIVGRDSAAVRHRREYFVGGR